MDAILTLNAGSSSVKFGVFRAASDPAPVAEGLVESIGTAPQARLKDAQGAVPFQGPVPADYAADHAGSLAFVLSQLGAQFGAMQIRAVGHRVVHGGADFDAPRVITPDVLSQIKALIPFAPLHQPHNIAGIDAATATFTQAVQVACFDTAFHRGHEFAHEAFAIPRAYYDKGIRRYGFHGLSYDYIAGHLANAYPDLHRGRVVVAHLGNGASLCALRGGRSVASTMGFTALDGVAMGTRPGQIDPGVLLYLMQQEGLSAPQISDLLYRQSGLLGLSGISADMRDLLSSDAPEAAQAVTYFCARIAREIAALAADMGGIDALVFTGGIGENAAPIRAQICASLDWLGLALQPEQNNGAPGLISPTGAARPVLAIPTNEELIIARAASRLIGDPEGA
ncbi:acetate/propionate family kinase [Marivivens sp.]|uniref:acetate/propionate family kinase n=1 Tax=Marivivens sp. TaxID=1978374 RepID=UPI0025B97776|nr:acetate/propionate family kinase [Marivivens sp.]